MKKILVIEDDKTLQDAIKNVVSTEEDFEVIQSFDGPSGFKKIKEEKPDIILLDLMLPKEDGYHMLYKLNEDKTTKKIPVIILTAIDSETSDIECKNFGAVEYLVKSDISILDIMKKIKEHLNVND